MNAIFLCMWLRSELDDLKPCAALSCPKHDMWIAVHWDYVTLRLRYQTLKLNSFDFHSAHINWLPREMRYCNLLKQQYNSELVWIELRKRYLKPSPNQGRKNHISPHGSPNIIKPNKLPCLVMSDGYLSMQSDKVKHKTIFFINGTVPLLLLGELRL